MRKEIEIFHLLFCKSLLTSGDKSLIVLKGGCNLRFFFGSNRYSEDIDFDIATIASATLRKRVEKVLASHSFRINLASKKIFMLSHTAPKQTETVQRWKVTLQFQNFDIPTKIEFSRRGLEQSGTAFDSVDPMLLGSYSISPLYMAHYNATFAMQQKIEALAGRSQTQARDIYDLFLLMSRNANDGLKVSKPLLLKSIEAAHSIDFDQFYGQVVEFLADDAKEYFSIARNWNDMQLKTTKMLENLYEFK